MDEFASSVRAFFALLILAFLLAFGIGWCLSKYAELRTVDDTEEQTE